MKSFPSFRFQHKGQNRKICTIQFPQVEKRSSIKFRSFEKLSEFSKFLLSGGKLGNLGNFQLPQTNKKNQLTLQVLRQFTSFRNFRFLYKGQNRKLGNLGNFQRPSAK